jgi:hypothetical protein
VRRAKYKKIRRIEGKTIRSEAGGRKEGKTLRGKDDQTVGVV